MSTLVNGQDLGELVEQRERLILQLLDAGRAQQDAIEHGRMSELLAILRAKQTPLEELNRVSEELRRAIGDDPDARDWPSSGDRQRCRERHERCESLIRELLELEARCEATLQTGRGRLEAELLRTEGARRAVSGYAASAGPVAATRRLDLSSG